MLFASLLCLLAALGPSPAPAPSPPRSLGDLLGDAAHERNGLERKRWIEDLHGPTDPAHWQAIERANADRARLARQALLDAGVRVRGVWTEVGSRNQAGHTRAVALGPPPELYVGSANGGVWHGDTEGSVWAPLGDGLFGGVDSVVHLAGEPSTLLVRRGPEVFWSDDDGRHWTRSAGLDGIDQLRALVVCGDTLLVLARWHEGAAAHAGILASGDRGRAFERRWKAPGDADGDLFVPPFAPGAAARAFVIHKGALYVSSDAGATFEMHALIDGRASAGELAGSFVTGATLYAALEIAGAWQLHRSDDGGATFVAVHEFADFWRTLVAVPEDPRVVLAGGMECHRSVDGGVSFERVNAWGHYYGDPAFRLHADVRGLDAFVDPTDAEASLLFVSTDGGTYLSRDRGASFRNLCLSGLGVGQVYSTLSSSRDHRRILAGTQDQGYQRGYLEARRARGPSADFEQLLSGDYGYLTSADGSHELVYSSYPGFVLAQEGEETPNLLYPWIDLPAGAQHAWMPPIVADPTEREVFYLLGDYLYRYARRRGPYWGYRRAASEPFTAGGGRYLTALAFAADTRRVYAANDVARVWVSEDHGATWHASEFSATFRATTIAVDAQDKDHLWIAGAGYAGPGVFVSRDGAASFAPRVAGLPATLVYDLAFGADDAEIYAATEAGPYRWRAEDEQWECLLGVEAPSTTYWSVEFVPGEEVVRFGTYGRGIWDYHPLLDAGEKAQAR